MLQALGFKLLDKDGNDVPFGAYGAGRVAKIDATGVIPELKECTFKVACDVTNPLLGKNGCTYVFSPQKGAKENELALMDSYLASYAEAVKKYNPAVSDTDAGCGAAGGIGFAFLAFLNGRLLRGIDLVTEATRLEEKIEKSDLVITGEGKMDYQSSMGKAPIGVAKLAKKHSKRVIAICGITGEGYEKCLDFIDRIYPIADMTKSVEWNMEKENACENIRRTVKSIEF
jgi:glycerate kinase